MRTALKSALAAALSSALVAAAGTSWAQGESTGQDQQVAKDQQVDLALGTLDTQPTLRLLEPPSLTGTRGPLPFDQEPPAAQGDFSDVTVPVSPRGPFGAKP